MISCLSVPLYLKTYCNNSNNKSMSQQHIQDRCIISRSAETKSQHAYALWKHLCVHLPRTQMTVVLECFQAKNWKVNTPNIEVSGVSPSWMGRVPVEKNRGRCIIVPCLNLILSSYDLIHLIHEQQNSTGKIISFPSQFVGFTLSSFSHNHWSREQAPGSCQLCLQNRNSQTFNDCWKQE